MKLDRHFAWKLAKEDCFERNKYSMYFADKIEQKESKDTSTKKENIVIAVFLALAVVLYNFIWLNKSFTMSEGWTKVYLELIESGKLPYRDYFYFLPPFNLVVDFVIWKLSFNYFFIFRCFRLAERVLITLIMHKILRRKLPTELSAVICFAGTILGSANVYDLVGDYNQTTQLLVVLLVYVLLRYFDSDERQVRWLILCGVIGGCMLGTKQTITLSSAIAFTVFFIIAAVFKVEKNIFKDLIYVLIGVAIPLSILGAYLVFTHSLSEFVYYVFKDTSSKGSLYDIALGSQISIFVDKIGMFIVILLLFAGKAITTFNENLKKYAHICQGLAAIIYAALYGIIYWNILYWDVKSLHFIIPALCIVALIFTKDKKYVQFVYPVVLLAYGISLILNPFGSTETIYYNGIFDKLIEPMTMIYMYTICWVIYHVVISAIRKERMFAVDKMVAASGIIASSYATSMAAGIPTVTSFMAYISIAAFAFIVYPENMDQESSFYKKIKLYTQIIVLFIFSICMSQKLVCSYSWWGDAEASYWDKTEKSDIQCLKGFKFSETEKNKYDSLYKIIVENTDSDSVIYGFPYASVYNIFTDNYNMNTFCPIPFYDVCPDDVAREDAEALKNNPPDIVVWVDIPGCLEAHETSFRGGDKMGQRDIIKWFDAAQDEYTLIGQVDNVFVYKYGDQDSVKSSFIEVKTKENTTLNIKDVNENDETVDISLLGQGTEEDPYLIESEYDMVYLRDMVNSGYAFAKEYIVQVCDIDLSIEDDWTPIGEFDSENLFRGIYDGNGYKISNLTIDSPDSHVGLFGQLAGTVMNLEIENCDVSGLYAGSIASQGCDALIINCIVAGKVQGSGRAGGVADNLAGSYVDNCVSCAQVEGEYAAGIAGYWGTNVHNCYSTMANDISKQDGDTIPEDVTTKLNEYIDELEFDYPLNQWSEENGELHISHRHVNNENSVMSVELDGLGTKDKPFLVKTVDDLKYIRELVNNGYLFRGKYIVQAVDLDLSTEENWLPIGIFENEAAFSGIYDGNGHMIANMTVNSPSENASLFARLQGTVVNLEMLNCYVLAPCTGGIASHGPNGQIINCLVTGTVSGGRCGGFADNMAGKIINCVSYAEIDAPEGGGISGYTTNEVVNCFSNDNVGDDALDGTLIDEDTLDKLNSYINNHKKEYKYELNKWLLKDGYLEIETRDEK